MSRPPRIPLEKKLRIVLAVLQGETTVSEAARREKVSEQAIGNWKRQFLPGRQTRPGDRQVQAFLPRAATGGRSC